MPYIDQESRDRLEIWANDRVDHGNGPKNAGELNYLITSLIHVYRGINGDRYQIYNDIIGALDGAKLEFYRRFVAPYEDQKIRINGDVP